jgi:cobalt-zinc-cadmium efflux system outer membrane protein
MPLEDLGFDESENKVGLQQTFELAGQPGARVDLAEARRDEAEAIYFERRARLAATVAKEFHRIVLTQAKAASARRMLERKRELLKLAETMRDTGRLAEVALIQYQVEADQTAVEVQKLEARVVGLMRDLEGRLGVPVGTVTACRGAGPSWAPADRDEAVRHILSRNPELIVLDRTLLVAQADLDLKSREAYPDPTLAFTYGRREDTDEGRDGFVGGFILVPLPVLDRNQGAIQSAEARVRQVEFELRRAARGALSQWEALRKRWEKLTAAETLYDERIIPQLTKEASLRRRQVDVGREPLQASLEATVRLEKAIAEALDVEVSLAELRTEMLLVTGSAQL